MSALLQRAPLAATRSRPLLSVIEGKRATGGDESGLGALQALGTSLRFGKNATIVTEGEPSAHVYKVVRGAVRSCRMLLDGRRQIADFFLPGDFFGLDWQNTCNFTAEALIDTVVISFPRHQVEQLGESVPGIHRLLMAMLCKGLSDTQEHVVMLGRQTAYERLAWFLLRVTERTGRGNEVDMPMSRMDIADYLGLTIETVSRGISEFKRRRYISVVNTHQMHLTGIEALRTLARGEAVA